MSSSLDFEDEGEALAFAMAGGRVTLSEWMKLSDGSQVALLHAETKLRVENLKALVTALISPMSAQMVLHGLQDKEQRIHVKLMHALKECMAGFEGGVEDGAKA